MVVEAKSKSKKGWKRESKRETVTRWIGKLIVGSIVCVKLIYSTKIELANQSRGPTRSLFKLNAFVERQSRYIINQPRNQNHVSFFPRPNSNQIFLSISYVIRHTKNRYSSTVTFPFKTLKNRGGMAEIFPSKLPISLF